MNVEQARKLLQAELDHACHKLENAPNRGNHEAGIEQRYTFSMFTKTLTDIAEASRLLGLIGDNNDGHIREAKGRSDTAPGVSGDAGPSKRKRKAKSSESRTVAQQSEQAGKPAAFGDGHGA